MTSADLARIKQLAEAARTRDVMACSDCDGSGEAQDGSACESCDGECWFSIKLKLAADVPALAAEVERLRAENELLREFRQTHMNRLCRCSVCTHA